MTIWRRKLSYLQKRDISTCMMWKKPDKSIRNRPIWSILLELVQLVKWCWLNPFRDIDHTSQECPSLVPRIWMISTCLISTKEMWSKVSMHMTTSFRSFAIMTISWWAAVLIKLLNFGTWCKRLILQQIHEKSSTSIIQGLNLSTRLPLSQSIFKERIKVWTTQISKCLQALIFRAQSISDPSSTMPVTKLLSTKFRFLPKSLWIFKHSQARVDFQISDLFSMLIGANSTRIFKTRTKSLTYTSSARHQMVNIRQMPGQRSIRHPKFSNLISKISWTRTSVASTQPRWFWGPCFLPISIK